MPPFADAFTIAERLFPSVPWYIGIPGTLLVLFVAGFVWMVAKERWERWRAKK